MIRVIFFIPVIIFFSSKIVRFLELILKINLGQIILILLILLFCGYQIKTYNLKTSLPSLSSPFQKEKNIFIKQSHKSEGLEIEFYKKVKEKNYFWK